MRAVAVVLSFVVGTMGVELISSNSNLAAIMFCFAWLTMAVVAVTMKAQLDELITALKDVYRKFREFEDETESDREPIRNTSELVDRTAAVVRAAKQTSRCLTEH